MIIYRQSRLESTAPIADVLKVEQSDQAEHEGSLSNQQPSHGSSQSADHQRYSYAGYEPQREFKDFTRERELIHKQRNNNQRGEYVARYFFIPR